MSIRIYFFCQDITSILKKQQKISEELRYFVALFFALLYYDG